MFSDFREHVLAVPQVAPVFGLGRGNVIFDGPHEDEDFGLEQVTGNAADRYKFRTSPLRNAALQPAFFHNGAFSRLEDAIRHHLDVFASTRMYHARYAGIDQDLTYHLGPVWPPLERLDPGLRKAIPLLSDEFEQLVTFVRDGLLDKRAKKQNLCGLIPKAVPSGAPLARFQGCPH